MPEEEEQETGTATAVDPSTYTDETNPAALGWYEPDPEDFSGATMVPTEDTTPDPNKTYYIVSGDFAAGTDTNEGVSNMSEAAALAYSTYQTYLMYTTTSGGTYTKLVDIKDYPDMLGDPNMLDATTLSDGQEKKISGILRLGDGLQFTANYTPTNFNTVHGLEGHTYWYALWLGGTSAGVPDGHNGKFSWTGDVRAGFPGKGVDEVQDMTITATPATDVQWSSGS